MPTFIDMSALTKRTTLTGNEEFQVSATEKVTAQQIADLADTGVKVVIVTNFKTNVWTELGQNTNIFGSIPIGEMVVFKSADDAASGPGEALIGYAIKYSNLIVTYVGMTTNNGVSVIPTLYTHKSAGVYDTKWQKLPDTDNGGVQTVEITDFAIPSVNITKDGQSFLFYANDASNIPNTNNGATSFVGVAIASPIFITGDQRLLYYMMVDTARGMFYTGRANLEDDIVAWNTTPVTRLGQAVQVTAFTESALSSLLYTYKAGDFIPFYTSSVTASEANQFPESGVFNGFISMGSNEGDYFQIFAFKSGSPNAYMGACIGSTTQWTKVSGGDSSKGTEDLKNWTTPTYVGANAGAGAGDYVDFLLTRALKSTDVILVTWRKQSASVKDVEIAGHAIFNPGAYSQDCCLDLLEDYQGNGDYYGLFLNQVTSEVGANMLTLYAESGGNSYGPQYLITGIYNISGK
jgi:hypothetical protein